MPLVLDREFSGHLKTVKAGNGEGELKFHLLTLLFRMEYRQTNQLCVLSGSAVNSHSWPSELGEVMWCADTVSEEKWACLWWPGSEGRIGCAGASVEIDPFPQCSHSCVFTGALGKTSATHLPSWRS